MDTIRAAGLAACAIGISFCNDAHTATDGGLLTSVAPPPNSRPLDRQSLPTGGEQATYMTTATPAGVISFYMQILPAGGWEVTDSDEESGAASLQVTVTGPIEDQVADGSWRMNLPSWHGLCWRQPCR